MKNRSRVERVWRGAMAAPVLLLAFAGCGGGGGAADSARADTTRVGASPATAGAVGGAGAAARRHTLLFVGTSLTAGLGLDPDSAFPQLVAQKIDSAGLPFEVINAGQSGETTAALLQRLDWLLRGEFDVIVLETGANDGLRGIPVPATRRNLDSIAARVVSARPKARVLLAQMEAPPNLGARYTAEFRAMFPAVARARGLTLMPFLLEGVAGHAELNQGDGIHPNMDGERVVAENVWRAVRPVLVEVAGRAVDRGQPVP